jgi:hypothetical protein
MTYGGIDELSTPCDEILFSGDMHIRQRDDFVPMGTMRFCSNDFF